MKRFENKVLYISDEKMLEDVRQLLIEKGFELDGKLDYDPYWNFMYFNVFDDNFQISLEINDTELTYEEFINLLNEE